MLDILGEILVFTDIYDLRQYCLTSKKPRYNTDTFWSRWFLIHRIPLYQHESLKQYVVHYQKIIPIIRETKRMIQLIKHENIQSFRVTTGMEKLNLVNYNGKGNFNVRILNQGYGSLDGGWMNEQSLYILLVHLLYQYPNISINSHGDIYAPMRECILRKISTIDIVKKRLICYDNMLNTF